MTATPRLFDDLLEGGPHLLENVGTVEHDPGFVKLAVF